MCQTVKNGLTFIALNPPGVFQVVLHMEQTTVSRVGSGRGKIEPHKVQKSELSEENIAGIQNFS